MRRRNKCSISFVKKDKAYVTRAYLIEASRSRSNAEVRKKRTDAVGGSPDGRASSSPPATHTSLHIPRQLYSSEDFALADTTENSGGGGGRGSYTVGFLFLSEARVFFGLLLWWCLVDLNWGVVAATTCKLPLLPRAARTPGAAALATLVPAKFITSFAPLLLSLSLSLSVSLSPRSLPSGASPTPDANSSPKDKESASQRHKTKTFRKLSGGNVAHSMLYSIDALRSPGVRANEQSRGGGDVVLVETVFLGRQGGYPVLA